MPALGGFLIGGPIGAALGLTGVVAVGLIGALTHTFGLSEDEARDYETRINEGGILIAVPAKSGDEMEVKDIMRN